MNSDKEILLCFMIFIMFIIMVIFILRHIIIKIKGQKAPLTKKQRKTNADRIGEIYSPKLYFPELIASFAQNMKKSNIKLPAEEVDEMQEALKKIAKKEALIELARLGRYMYPSEINLPIKKRIIASWWLVFDQIKEIDSLKKYKEKEMNTNQCGEKRRGENAKEWTDPRNMTIEEFETKVYQILDRPFTIEYLSFYKHKRISVKEDPFNCNSKQIAWCIGSTYEEAFPKMLNLLSGERK